MFCPKCGNKIEEGKKFCNKCGYKIVNDDSKTSEKEIKPQSQSEVEIKKTEYKSIELSESKEIEQKPIAQAMIKNEGYKPVEATQEKETLKANETEYEPKEKDEIKIDKYDNSLDENDKKKKSFLVPIVLVAVFIGLGFLIYNFVIKPNHNDDASENYVMEQEYSDDGYIDYDETQSQYDYSSEVMSNNNLLTSQILSVNPVSSYSEDTSVYGLDTVTFGRYPQSSGNEPIEWIILEKDEYNHRALLLSKYVIDCKSYNNVRGPITWEYCNLRQWLNDGFYHLAFNEDEKNIIELSEIINYNNSTYGTNGGNSTYDKVFLLSINEATRYFNQYSMQTDNYRLATKATNYAKNVNNMGDRLFVNNRNEWSNGNSWFWLRSPANAQDCAASVNSNGYLDEVGDPVNATKGGVRPAIWVSY